MTFTEIRTEILARLNLTSTEAQARIGREINVLYKRLTSSIGLVTSRRVEVQEPVTLGNRRVTFDGVERIESVFHRSSGRDKVLAQVTFDELRETHQGTGIPTKYAIDRVGSNSVTIFMNSEPADALTLYVDGHTEVATLSDTDEPAFPESFHDALVEGVMADEYRKLEKMAFSQVSQGIYESRVSDLRMFMAKSSMLENYQGKTTNQGGPWGSGGGSGGGSGSSTPSGSSSYTQTGTITFDRDPLAPFVVTASSAVVSNLDADKLDGEHGSAYHNATNLNAGTVPDARFPATLPAASGVNLTALNASNLASGSVPDNRLSSNVPLKDSTNSWTGANVFNTLPLSLDVGQLAFPATQNPSADANTLDDYEEGSWAPALGGTGGSSGQAYTTQIGRYTKIGKNVTCWGRLTMSTLGTLTTQVTLEGLPFTCDATARGSVIVPYFTALTANCIVLAGQVSVNSVVATMFVIKAAGTGMANLVQGDLSNTTELAFLVSYRSAN